MRDKFNQFIANVNGQFIEVSDRSNIYQCMDLAFLWVFILGLPKETIQHLYAYEVFTRPNDLTNKHFDLILNTPEAIPQDGDMVVWSNQFGFAGHIGIALGGGTTNTFRVFEQNAPLGTNAHIGTRNYTNVLGWLRPINSLQSANFTDQTIIPGSLLKGEDMEIQAIRGKLGDLEKAQKQVKEMESNLSRLIGELIVINKELEIQKNIYDSLLKAYNVLKSGDSADDNHLPSLITLPPLIQSIINWFKKWFR